MISHRRHQTAGTPCASTGKEWQLNRVNWFHKWLREYFSINDHSETQKTCAQESVGLFNQMQGEHDNRHCNLASVGDSTLRYLWTESLVAMQWPSEFDPFNEYSLSCLTIHVLLPREGHLLLQNEKRPSS